MLFFDGKADTYLMMISEADQFKHDGKASVFRIIFVSGFTETPLGRGSTISVRRGT